MRQQIHVVAFAKGVLEDGVFLQGGIVVIVRKQSQADADLAFLIANGLLDLPRAARHLDLVDSYLLAHTYRAVRHRKLEQHIDDVRRAVGLSI